MDAGPASSVKGTRRRREDDDLDVQPAADDASPGPAQAGNPRRSGEGDEGRFEGCSDESEGEVPPLGG